MMELLYLVFWGTLVVVGCLAVMAVKGLRGPTGHSETRAVRSQAAVLWTGYDNLPGVI